MTEPNDADVAVDCDRRALNDARSACSMTSSFAYRLGMARCEDTDEQVAFLRTFGLGIKLLRVAHGLSQQALAEAAGLHRTFVGRLERGQHGVNVAELPQLARALGVPARELIPVLEEVDGRD